MEQIHDGHNDHDGEDCGNTDVVGDYGYTYKTAREARLALQSFFLDSTGEYACRDWTLADWSNAMCGETGEAANIVKKIRRGDIDPELVRKLGDELADLSAYIDLLAFHAGIDLDKAIERKYNQLSLALGSETRLIKGELISNS